MALRLDQYRLGLGRASCGGWSGWLWVIFSDWHTTFNVFCLAVDIPGEAELDHAPLEGVRGCGFKVVADVEGLAGGLEAFDLCAAVVDFADQFAAGFLVLDGEFSFDGDKISVDAFTENLEAVRESEGEVGLFSEPPGRDVVPLATTLAGATLNVLWWDRRDHSRDLVLIKWGRGERHLSPIHFRFDDLAEWDDRHDPWLRSC